MSTVTYSLVLVVTIRIMNRTEISEQQFFTKQNPQYRKAKHIILMWRLNTMRWGMVVLLASVCQVTQSVDTKWSCFGVFLSYMLNFRLTSKLDYCGFEFSLEWIVFKIQNLIIDLFICSWIPISGGIMGASSWLKSFKSSIRIVPLFSEII